MPEPLIDQTRPFNLPIGADTALGSDLKMRFDSDDNVSHLVRGASNQTTIRDLGPAVQAVEIVGSQVTDAGALAVVQKAAGPPIVRAGITGTDAYVALFVLDRDCSYVSVGSITHGLTVGATYPNSGATNVVAAVCGAGNGVFPGVPLPKGTTIKVINTIAASAGASGTVMVW